MIGSVPKLFPSKKWPANSPDVSAIENMFGYVQDIVDKKNPTTIKGLKKIIKKEFKSLTPATCQNFISALPSRLNKIIESKGEHCYK
jgi:hypothetical protein